MPRVAFTAKTRKYLGSLDAVESVTQYRIRYSKEFRDDCMRRYAEGGSPAAIFREAGLDPKIIGYKGKMGLRGALSTLGGGIRMVSVSDVGVTLDADHPEEYQTLLRLSRTP